MSSYMEAPGLFEMMYKMFSQDKVVEITRP